MRNDIVATLSWDEDAGQVRLEGFPEGPGGGASLILAEGVELVFGCATGELSRVCVAAGDPGGPPTIAEPAALAIRNLFGARARDAIRLAARKDGDPISLKPEPATLAALSRLARLDAARLTSPVSGSLLWGIEAAQLAARAGLSARTAAEAQATAAALDEAADLPAGVLEVAARAMAELVAAAEPDLARRLREATTRPVLTGPAGAGSAGTSRKRARPFSLPDLATDTRQRGGDLDQLHWGLDPRLVPAGIFGPQLWPDAELTVRPERSRLIVEATLAPGADPRALAACRARLVDPASRSVLATASFRELGDSRVRAEIRKRRPPHEAWVEIVDDVNRPVLSAKLRHIRRAMRWADAALSAGRQTFGLADAEWTRLAAVAWGRCAEEWAAAGDQDRAYLAAAREVAMYPGVEIRAEPPSAWAKELVNRPPVKEEPFLAEQVT
jgi:hypothetical protein